MQKNGRTLQHWNWCEQGPENKTIQAIMGLFKQRIILNIWLLIATKPNESLTYSKPSLNLRIILPIYNTTKLPSIPVKSDNSLTSCFIRRIELTERTSCVCDFQELFTTSLESGGVKTIAKAVMIWNTEDPSLPILLERN